MPRGLSAEARKRWTELVAEYDIHDSGGRLIVETFCRALMTAREAEAAIARSGVEVLDRYDKPKSHPLLPALRDARSQMLLALKQLNLDVIPAKPRHEG